MSKFNPGPESHRFNWGSAYRMSSTEIQFARLQEAFEQSVLALNGDYDDDDPRTDIRFYSHEEGNRFYICRQPGSVSVDHIIFSHNAGRILISDDSSSGSMEILTSVLNEDGQIRFQINGEGAYLRWQIVRKYLERLLGQSDRS